MAETLIPLAPFGRTGHWSTRTLFGAAALWSATQDEADAVLDVLFRYGVNHIDVAANYNMAERRVGPWMDRYREQFFLATKTEERTAQGAQQDLERSLERLHTELIDLWQLHNLVDEGEWETAMGPGGALEAAIQARQEGRVRFIGVTGHGVTAPRMHRRALERFDFDAVLFPYNYPMMQNPQYAEDVQVLLEIAAERNVAVQTIKSLARRHWPDQESGHSPWYQPLEEQADIDLAVHWVLGQAGIFLNTTANIQILPRLLEAASRYQSRPGDMEMLELLDKEGMQPLFV